MSVLSRTAAMLLICSAAFSAAAQEHVTARVTIVEPTYMPGAVSFMLSAGTATCPSGVWLRWAKDAENNKAVYATLLAALNSGKSVNFYHAVGDKTCTGQFLHALGN